MFYKRTFAFFSLVMLWGLSGCLKKSSDAGSDTHDLSKVLLMEDVAPVVIVGSGPAGLTAAIYVARAGMQAFVFSGSQPGGQLTSTTYIENWPGVQKSLGADLMKDIKQQAVSFGACIINDTITNIDFDTWPFSIQTDNGRSFSALTVIVATGATPRRMNIPGEEQYWGKGVTTCAVCDAPMMKQKDVVIIGGGDTAAEQVFELAPYAKNITVLVRKDTLKASDAQRERMLAFDNVTIEFNKELREVHGEHGEVNLIDVYDNKKEVMESRPIGGVFLAIGHTPNSKILPDKIKNEYGFVNVQGKSQRTSIPGVFAAGEIQDNEYKQAVVAAGEGAKAALDATSFLYELGFNKEVSNRLEKSFFETFSEHRLPLTSITQVEELDREVLNRKGLVLLDFYANYCPGCIKMLPILETVAHELQDQVTIIKANHEVSKDVIYDLYFNYEKFGVDDKIAVKRVPSLLVFKDGKYLDTSSDIMSQRELLAFVRSFLD